MCACKRLGTANLRTKILDFRGFDSSIILVLRGGILISTGGFPDILSQEILAGIILVGRLGVDACKPRHADIDVPVYLHTAYSHTYTFMCLHMYVYMYMYVYIYIYMYMYVYVSVYMCLHT